MDIKKFDTHIKPTWCPGCGNFGIFTALKQALGELKIEPHQLVVVTDVGCSGNMADFIKAYVFHALHGRTLPVAAGVKLANHKLKVLAIIGDGGCYGEGLTHYVNLMRGNHDICVLVHDNNLYGLTTGQYSPTTPKGTITKSTPEGSIEEALNPIALALANKGTFVARGFAGDISHLKNLIIKGIRRTGFSLIDIFQPCVTWNKNQTFEYYQEKVYKLEKPLDRQKAFEKALDLEKLAIGVFYQEKRKAYHQEVSELQEKTMVERSIKKVDIGKLLEKFN